MMAVGILADDKNRYNKAVGVFHNIVNDYLKWGKGNFAGNRVLGECSETMRDIFHSQFGELGCCHGCPTHQLLAPTLS